jgi:hypothetical protein
MFHHVQLLLMFNYVYFFIVTGMSIKKYVLHHYVQIMKLKIHVLLLDQNTLDMRRCVHGVIISA